MAINPVIPRGLLNDPCNTSHVKQWRSYEPAIVFLQYTLTKPTLIPRWKEFRGEMVECGYTIRWPTLNCIAQKEQGPSLTHTFDLGTLAPGTRIWYRVSTSCSPTNPISFSPPIEYVIPPCSTTGTFCKVQRTVNSPQTDPAVAVMTTFVAGDPNMHNVPLGAITIQPPATWNMYAYGQITNRLGSPTVPSQFDIYIESTAGGFQSPKVSTSLTANQTFDFVVNYTFTKTDAIARNFRLIADKTTGPAALVRFNCSPTVPAVLAAIRAP